jgi:folate-binding protein YgfZ
VTDVPDLRARLGAVRLARDVVRVSGPDAATYLQGQASQDVAGLAVGATTWSFVLQPTGKVEAWVRVTRPHDDEFVLDTDVGAGEALATRLRRFLLRTKADIEATTWPVVALRGPGAEALAGADEGAWVPAGWPGSEGADLLGPAVAAPAGVDEVPVEAYESLRIRSGVPAMGRELTDRTIPAEAGQWMIDASVSFTKGCFTGQELVARIDSRGGNVPRHLRALVAAAGGLEVGAGLIAGDEEVGTVTSVAPHPAGGDVGLGYLGRAVAPPAELEARGAGGSIAVTALATPLAD